MRRLVFSMRNTAPARLIRPLRTSALAPISIERVCSGASAATLAFVKRPLLGRRVVGVAVGGIDGGLFGRVDDPAEAIAEQIVGALQIAVDDQHLVRVAIVGGEAVVAQRREQLEVLGDLDLVGHIGGVVGRLGVDRQVVDDGAADRRAVGIGIERKGAAGIVGRVAEIAPVLVARLVRGLEPRRHLVFRDAGDELADEVGLVDEIGVVGLALAPLATVGQLVHRIVERKRRSVPGRGRPRLAGEVVVGEADVARRGHPREALIVDVARGIGELQILVEFMLDLFRDDVGVGRRDIAERPAREPEEVGAGNRERRRGPAVAVVAGTGLSAGLGIERSVAADR